jgi:predicted SnoaL-like aldol condensation-catalyzing enzyme
MKITLLCCAVTFCFFACKNNDVTQSIANNNEANKIIIEQYFAHFNKHEWKQMAAMYTNSAEMKDPAFGIQNVILTQAEIEKKYTELQKAIPDVQDSIVQMYFSKNNVIVQFESKGTAPDGIKFTLPICTIFEITNSKISKDFTYYDNMEEPKNN